MDTCGTQSGPLGTRRTRRGRHSVRYAAYHVITSSLNREPVFNDFAAARILIRTLRREQDADHVMSLAFVVMPDHMHWLVQLKSDRTLSDIMDTMKSRSARQINRHLRRRGPLWQRGFWDRAVRQDEDLLAIARYIVANPLRAGLVKLPGGYPHWDSIWV